MGKDYVYCLFEGTDLIDIYKQEKHCLADKESLENRFTRNNYKKERRQLMDYAIWENEDK